MAWQGGRSGRAANRSSALALDRNAITLDEPVIHRLMLKLCRLCLQTDGIDITTTKSATVRGGRITFAAEGFDGPGALSTNIWFYGTVLEDCGRPQDGLDPRQRRGRLPFHPLPSLGVVVVSNSTNDLPPSSAPALCRHYARYGALHDFFVRRVASRPTVSGLMLVNPPCSGADNRTAQANAGWRLARLPAHC
jgi:hypothetical protein